MGPMQGMQNVPGSKPTLVPPGSSVQMASPWAASQPAWGQAQRPAWRAPLFPMGLLSPQMLPGMQQQVAAANPPPVSQPANAGVGNDQPTGNPQPDKPAAPMAPTQSAVSQTLGSVIDPSVYAGLSPEERANYQIDPDSRTWFRVR